MSRSRTRTHTFSHEIDRINSRRTNVACLCNTALCWAIMKAETNKRNTNSMFFHRWSRYASRDRWTLFYLLFSCTLVSLTQVKLNFLVLSSIGNGISFTVQRQPLQRISHREERLGRGSVMAQPLLIFLEHFLKSAYAGASRFSAL